MQPYLVRKKTVTVTIPNGQQYGEAAPFNMNGNIVRAVIDSTASGITGGDTIGLVVKDDNGAFEGNADLQFSNGVKYTGSAYFPGLCGPTTIGLNAPAIQTADRTVTVHIYISSIS